MAPESEAALSDKLTLQEFDTDLIFFRARLSLAGGLPYPQREKQLIA